MVTASVLIGRAVFGVFLAAASLFDTRWRRLPNALMFGGLALALAWHAWAPPGAGLFARANAGALGIGPAAFGALAMFGCFFVLYSVRVMGAGDVKFLTALGAAFTVTEVWRLVVFVFLAGGVMSLARIADRRRRALVLQNLKTIVYSGVATATHGVGPRFDPAADSADRLPFGVAISIGAAIHAATIWFELLR